jgi:predicted AAA+ superfamily ATPase
MYKRQLDIKTLVSKANFFLFGPRATGKSSLIRTALPDALNFDLLDDDVYDELMKRPKALGEKIHGDAKLVVIDEIQKLPILLDEVHRLIESRGIHFLLTGSSARKLKRDGANMLAGRAREAHLFPLVYPEITDFDLIRFLNFGGLPIIYLSVEPMEDLRAYVRTYLNEEIKKEAAVRKYERFVRFLETMALSNGQEINYASLSSDSGVPARTIEGHIEILKDTLIGFELLPFRKTLMRKATAKSKFYFFDTGVANFLGSKLPMSESNSDLGISFEQFIIQEIRAYLSYNRKFLNLSYWKSKSFEVDLIVGNELAIKIKFAKAVKDEFFKGLKALAEEKLIKKYAVIGRFTSDGEKNSIPYYNYKSFLDKLWAHQIL